jgi:MSHA biogenesis protein MshO
VIRRDRAALGFTLIELVIVIAIMAILAVFMVFFLDTPVEAYMAQSRRAVLVDSADHVLRSVAADVRTALPSSLRSGAAGNVVAVEMLSTVGVARYYGPNEKSGLPPAQEALEELSIGSADTDFYTLGQFVSVNGAYLAIGTQTTIPGAYSFGNVMTPLPKSFAVSPVGATVEDWVHFAGAGFDFAPPPDSPTNSVFVVSGPVSYLCDTGQHTLQRYSGYTVTAAQPLTDAALMAAGATRGLIAQNVSACTVSIVPAPASGAFDMLLILEVTLASSGETLTVFDEAAPEYVP